MTLRAPDIQFDNTYNGEKIRRFAEDYKRLIRELNQTILDLQAQIEAIVSAGGEANSGLNVGGGAGVFKSKVGLDLLFKSLLGAGTVTVSEQADTITITGIGGGGGSVSFEDIENILANQVFGG